MQFTHAGPGWVISKENGVSQRSINELLTKLRRRIYEDVRLDPMIQIHGDYGRPPASNPFWQHHRACLYDCPTLREGPYPRPAAKAVSTPWHPSDYEEWCGRCGVLPHRRSLSWKPLETWSRMNRGLPSGEAYAHHIIYAVLVGFTFVIAEIDWRKIILDVLAKDPL